MKKHKNIFFALHGVTKENQSCDKTFDAALEELGYNKAQEEFINNKTRDYAKTQNDDELTLKGVYQSVFMGKQLLQENYEIKTIYCANHKRCLQTAQIIAKTLSPKTKIVIDSRLNARFYSKVAEEILEKYSEMCYGKLPKKLIFSKCLKLYSVAPSKFGVEPKNTFYARLENFFNDPNIKSENSLIVAGRDVWDFMKAKKLAISFKGNKITEIKRGQVVSVDFCLNNEQSLCK